MKKILFTLLCMMLALVNAEAQSSLVATLSHEGNIKTFYGAGALESAYEAAVDGDLITLSSGTFKTDKIKASKFITIRGVGWNADADPNSMATYLKFLRINNDSRTSTLKFRIEGVHLGNAEIYSEWGAAEFYKCYINFMTYFIGQGEYWNLKFVNCYVNDYNCPGSVSTICLNSVIKGSVRNSELKNCILSGDSRYYTNCVFENCIYDNGYNFCFDSSSTAINSISVGEASYNVFGNQNNNTNKVVAGYDIFKTFRGDFNKDETFELTDEAAAEYLGSDGTQVGIYGGMLPYSITPNVPQITKFNVSKKSSPDGKLNVEIEVVSPK